MRPWQVIVKSISAWTCDSCVTSARTKSQPARMDCATARPYSSRRPAITSFAPSAAKTSAVRLPMPLVAPVTMHTLSWSRPMPSPPVPSRRPDVIGALPSPGPESLEELPVPERGVTPVSQAMKKG